jgi:rare lipoprotein A (peptidoglycan hydrolase)
MRGKGAAIAAALCVVAASAATLHTAAAQSFAERWASLQEPPPPAHFLVKELTVVLQTATGAFAALGGTAASENLVPPPNAYASVSPLLPEERGERRSKRAFSGGASFYSHQGRLATGDRYFPEGLTAAHRTLPFGTRVRVTDVKTRKSVDVVINDRGPYKPGRVIDLSLGAARALEMTSRGVIQVKAEVIDQPVVVGRLGS